MSKGKNRRIIKSILSKQLNDWINSITDEDLQSRVRKDTIITGGCIASLLLGEDIKDFDLYFATQETAVAVANYYTTKFMETRPHVQAYVQVGTEDGTISYLGGEEVKGFVAKYKIKGYKDENGEEVWYEKKGLEPGRIRIFIQSSGVAGDVPDDEPFEDVFDVIDAQEQEEEQPKKEKYRPVFLSSNAITLSDRVQLITRFHGNPDEIHTNYDFVHATNYFHNNKLELRPEAMEALLARELVYVGSKYPLCSVIRTRKFLKRGYHINAGQYLKMMFQISQLDLTDVETLEEQLIGVDSAYFGMLIDALRTAQKKDEDWKVELNYVTEIINRIF